MHGRNTAHAPCTVGSRGDHPQQVTKLLLHISRYPNDSAFDEAEMRKNSLSNHRSVSFLEGISAPLAPLLPVYASCSS